MSRSVGQNIDSSQLKQLDIAAGLRNGLQRKSRLAGVSFAIQLAQP
jgi:hypothetical protein